MGPSLSSRGRAARSPFTLASSWASEVRTSPQHLAAGYLLPYVVSAELPMVSERGTGEPRGSPETTDCPCYGFTNSTVPATGPRESSASFSLTRHSRILFELLQDVKSIFV